MYHRYLRLYQVKALQCSYHFAKAISEAMHTLPEVCVHEILTQVVSGSKWIVATIASTVPHSTRPCMLTKQAARYEDRCLEPLPIMKAFAYCFMRFIKMDDFYDTKTTKPRARWTRTIIRLNIVLFLFTVILNTYGIWYFQRQNSRCNTGVLLTDDRHHRAPAGSCNANISQIEALRTDTPKILPSI
jgi:hypothetical protein